jgi:hypothetical protein
MITQGQGRRQQRRTKTEEELITLKALLQNSWYKDPFCDHFLPLSLLFLGKIQKLDLRKIRSSNKKFTHQN